MSRKVFKVVVAGDGGIGKTTLMFKYTKGVFIDTTKMTIGVEFHEKNLIVNSNDCSLQIWDFGGQERFRFMHPIYTKGAMGALLGFDLTRPTTLDDFENWINIIRTEKEDLPILLVGTKYDLKDQLKIDDEIAKEVMEAFELYNFIKVSSMEGINISECFENLTKEMIRYTGDK